ncbi:hypothetical protein VPH35_070513 [Triticum aestivum]
MHLVTQKVSCHSRPPFLPRAAAGETLAPTNPLPPSSPSSSPPPVAAGPLAPLGCGLQCGLRRGLGGAVLEWGAAARRAPMSEARTRDGATTAAWGVERMCTDRLRPGGRSGSSGACHGRWLGSDFGFLATAGSFPDAGARRCASGSSGSGSGTLPRAAQLRLVRRRWHDHLAAGCRGG